MVGRRTLRFSGLALVPTLAAFAVSVAVSRAAESHPRTVLITTAPSGADLGVTASAASVSADGRYVVFRSVDASNVGHIFVKDRETGTVTQADTGASGQPGDGNADQPAISADGRYVGFLSQSTTLIAGSAGFAAVYRKDMLTHAVALVSALGNGTQDYWPVTSMAMSDSGQAFAWTTSSLFADPNDSGGYQQLFWRNVQTGEFHPVIGGNRDNANEPTGNASEPALSPSGRWITWVDSAKDIVPGDTSTHDQVFVDDLSTGATSWASVNSAGGEADGGSAFPTVAETGLVAFSSSATNLTTAKTTAAQIYVHDPIGGSTTPVSLAGHGQPDGPLGNASSTAPAITGDGNSIAFMSYATNLLPDTTNNSTAAQQVYVADLKKNGSLREVSLYQTGADAPDGAFMYAGHRTISATGRWVAFQSADALTPAANAPSDIFLGNGGAEDTPANARFTVRLTPLSVFVDGRSSTAPDGWVAGYAWTFGDGGTATGAQGPHQYASPGHYTIVLTVTDNEGKSTFTQQTVTVSSGSHSGGPGGHKVTHPPATVLGVHRSKQTLVVSLSCPRRAAASCAGTFELALVARRRHVGLPSLRYSLAVGGSAKLRVTLSAKALAVLKHHKSTFLSVTSHGHARLLAIR